MTSGIKSFRLGAVILAAGRSSRMGQSKMLLPWGNTTVLGHLIRLWKTLDAAPVLAVVSADDQAILIELDRLGLPALERVMNPDPDRGMFSSIQCASRWEGTGTGPTHWALVLGDQPHIRLETLRELIEFAATEPHRVCQLSRRARPRHPVILPNEVFLQLRVTTHFNLKDFLGSLPESPALSESADGGLDLDLDTPADYERAKAIHYGAGQVDR